MFGGLFYAEVYVNWGMEQSRIYAGRDYRLVGLPVVDSLVPS